jgi:hypothetical protein
MTEPKFKIGQSVCFRPGKRPINVRTDAPYLVIKRLPLKGSEFYYRIRNEFEGHVARERELRPVNA